ncbi:hypothetical protein [Candidatus Entotheonella palauensis]|uniref:Uncharacterized protein n=1 Tax=Candidatus Entotheonella gemina TaxID=1429439 RepID=W4LIK5_9BACT|nr:hypothetical protein [Candidatus Entotheonella palauensis]ETW97933.1 MAG: hypothetical protein ETSY2_43615 [Candidatus Entotheonella gemina]
MKRLEWYSWRFGPRFSRLERNAVEYWWCQVHATFQYATFQDGVPGMRCRDLIGVENLMWASALILGSNMVRVYNLQDVFEPLTAP